MMHFMRTTVDLPPAVHRRVRDLADQQGQSLSAVLADLVVRGLAERNEPVTVSVDPVTGLPSLSLARTLTDADVRELLDEE